MAEPCQEGRREKTLEFQSSEQDDKIFAFTFRQNGLLCRARLRVSPVQGRSLYFVKMLMLLHFSFHGIRKFSPRSHFVVESETFLLIHDAWC